VDEMLDKLETIVFYVKASLIEAIHEESKTVKISWLSYKLHICVIRKYIFENHIDIMTVVEFLSELFCAFLVTMHHDLFVESLKLSFT
jgi:hypothetical protein